MKDNLKKIFNKDNLKGFFKETIETIVFVVVMVIIIRFFIGEIRWIPSSSMEPTLTKGDRLFVERYSRFFKSPKRGDVIVFYPPMEEIRKGKLATFERLTGFFCKDIAYIKRIVGMPKDKVELKRLDVGKYIVLINDKPLDEPYILSEDDYIDCKDGMFCGPMTVPDGNFFMLGDNRGNSQDSRFWGYLPAERVIGRATFVFWPLNHLKMLSFRHNES